MALWTEDDLSATICPKRREEEQVFPSAYHQNLRATAEAPADADLDKQWTNSRQHGMVDQSSDPLAMAEDTGAEFRTRSPTSRQYGWRSPAELLRHQGALAHVSRPVGRYIGGEPDEDRAAHASDGTSRRSSNKGDWTVEVLPGRTHRVAKDRRVGRGRQVLTVEELLEELIAADHRRMTDQRCKDPWSSRRVAVTLPQPTPRRLRVQRHPVVGNKVARRTIRVSARAGLVSVLDGSGSDRYVDELVVPQWPATIRLMRQPSRSGRCGTGPRLM